MTARRSVVSTLLWSYAICAAAACTADSAAKRGGAGQAPPFAGAGSGGVDNPMFVPPGAGMGSSHVLPPVGNECAGVSASTQARLAPTDVVWAIDTSGSMIASFAAIQQALDAFSRKVVEAGVDARVVLLAGSGFCVGAPLGSGQCGPASAEGMPAPDSREPDFLHLDTPFGANQGIPVLLDSYAAYKHALRPGARTHLVLTEDGAPTVSAQAVIDHVEGRAQATATPAWMPGLAPRTWVFNGVVCQNGFALGTCLLADSPPATTLELIDTTGGLVADLNNAGVAGMDPFAQLLDKLAESVIVGAQVSCEYRIPESPEDMTFDPDQVNVVYTNGAGHQALFPRADDAMPCAEHEAWTYDMPDAPTLVRLCPAACTRVQADPAARIDVKFGCETMVLAPQ